MGIHWQELIVILLIVLVLFGPKRLPEIGRSLGNGIREFRETMSGTGQSAERHADAHRATATAASDTSDGVAPAAAVPAPVAVEVVEPHESNGTGAATPKA